jgi:hypothetical protein
MATTNDPTAAAATSAATTLASTSEENTGGETRDRGHERGGQVDMGRWGWPRRFDFQCVCPCLPHHPLTYHLRAPAQPPITASQPDKPPNERHTHATSPAHTHLDRPVNHIPNPTNAQAPAAQPQPPCHPHQREGQHETAGPSRRLDLWCVRPHLPRHPPANRLATDKPPSNQGFDCQRSGSPSLSLSSLPPFFPHHPINLISCIIYHKLI